MLPTSSLCKAAGRGWGIEDFIPESLAGAKRREKNVSNSTCGGSGEFVLLCLILKPTISSAPLTALGA